MATTTARSRHEERIRLTAQIDEWNSNRLDLFALSQPNEDLEFFGVMRFFYQDEGEKVSTKCVRVSSTASTKDVMGILIEKFRPDLRMLSRGSYALYEVHVNGEERQLRDNERPLLVQLHWGKDDREGRFLLKRETDKTMLVDCTAVSANQSLTDAGQSFKRKLSKREKKELKKKEKEQKLKGKENDSGVAEKLYNELPESSFTRSISNPELVMRKRRQLKLEKKLQQIRSNDGGPDAGGTLKIYGTAVNPDVPYKTLLLAVTDTVAHVVKETLEKYGMEKEDPDKFCLIQTLIPPDGPDYGKESRERVLDDDECPLAIILQHPPSKGTIMFQLRPRTANMPQKSKKKPVEGFRDDRMFVEPLPQQLQQQQLQQQPQLPFLLQISADNADSYSPKKYFLTQNSTEIGRDRNSSNPKIPYIQLATQDILPLHCVVDNKQGVVTVTPVSKEALIFVNGTRVSDTTVLRHGMVVQFGKLHQYRFFNGPDGEKGRQVIPSELIQSSRGATPRDFETTFDVDGRVETFRNQVTNERSVQQQQLLGPDPRFGPPGYEADLLPASLNVPDEVEDKFLTVLINDDNLTNIQFRMAPTYIVYMVVRSRLLQLNRPDMSPSKQSWIVNSITNKVAQMIYQKIKDVRMNPGLLSFWMANASEMLNFFKRDADVVSSCLPAQNLLAEAVQLAFNFLVDQMQAELGQAMPAFLNPKPDGPEQDADASRYSQMAPTISNVLQVLSSAMTVLRRCRVNAALTIQLFSQLFHFINMWIFNRLVLEPQLHLCTRFWGQMLRQRLSQIESWAEQQGLELAAECHLTKVLQATFLLESPKLPNDIGTILSTCESLNSVQMHRLLTNYVPSRGEAPLRSDVVDQLILGSQNTVDEMLRNEGLELRIDEPVSLQLPFLLPDDGYSCEFVKGVPNGLGEFLMPFVQNGICRFAVNHQSRGSWMIYMTNQEDCHTYQNLKSASKSPEVPSSAKSPDASLRMEPEVITISFSKVKNSLGLSIVAAKGEGQREKAIYVKSVVAGGGAATDGRIQAGDQLIEVDGKSLLGVSQERAAEMMTQTGQMVTLKVAKQAAMFHGLATLLSQTQQPPNANWGTKPGGIGDGGKMPSKSNTSSQPTLASTRPLSDDFRNSPRPINQQLEAKSTPVLTDGRFRDQMSGEVDVYPGNYRSSPQTAQGTRVDPLRYNSSSQPDLINRRPDTIRDDAAGHVTGPPAFISGPDDLARYGIHMKGAISSPNISTQQPQKGFTKSDNPDHQRIVEWQQRNQMMAEHDHREQMRVSGSMMDGAKNPVGSAREFPYSARPEFSAGSSVTSADDERGRKLEPVDAIKLPVKPVLPYQPQQPASKKGPGYATQMLFPGSAQAKAQTPKDVTPIQGYQSNQQQGYQQSNQQPGYQSNQQQGFMANKPSGQPNIQSQGYGAVGNSQSIAIQGRAYPVASLPQAYVPAQSRNFPGNVPPSGGAYVAPIGSTTAQQSEYRPISEFSRGYVPHSQVTDDSQIGPSIRKNPAAGDLDFPPPPTDLHLAQLGVQVMPGDASVQQPGLSSSYGPLVTSTSATIAKTDANPRTYDPGRFSQGDKQMPSLQVNQPTSLYGFQENISGYPDRRGADEITRPVPGHEKDGYQWRPDSTSGFSQPGLRGVPHQPLAKKPPPPIAAKPKIGGATGVASGIDLKAYPSSPWEEKDAKEKKMDEELRIRRLEEIKRLESRPYRSPEEQGKLQRLLTEAEFDRRAEEANEEKDSEVDGMESQAATMRRLDEEFQSRHPLDKRPQQPEPMYAKVDKQHLPSDNVNRIHGDIQRPGFPVPGDIGRRQPEQQMVKPPQGSDYSRSTSGTPGNGWQYEAGNQDPGQLRYPAENYSHPQLRDSARQIPQGGYPSSLEAEMPRPMLSTSGSQMPYSQSEYSSSYQPPSKSVNDVFSTSAQSSQSSGVGQQSRTGTVSALKQPDSQGVGGSVKKSVTFNENIGVNEYTINRSYGSTSSESSFPQSPEQAAGLRPPSDQPPVPPLATYMTAIRPGSSGVPQQQQQYEPSAQPSYLQHPRNPEPSYPYGSSESRYPYNGPSVDGSARSAMPYKPPSQDQGQFHSTDFYTSDPRYPLGGPYQPPQQQYPSRHSLYSHPQDPVYGRQQQPTKDRAGPDYPTEPATNAAYAAGHGTAVVGSQEVYRDPRDRIMASKSALPGMVPSSNQRSTPDRMSFRDKMSMFASETGD